MKNLIAIVLVAVMLLGMLPVVSFAKTILISENFEDYAINETNVSKKSFKTGGTAGTSFTVATPPYSSNRALKVVNDGTGLSSGTSANVYLQIDKKGLITIELSVMPTDLSTTTKIGITSPVYSGYPPLVMISNTGFVLPYSDAPLYTYSQPFDPNKWIRIKLIIDTEKEVYDYYYNDYKEASGIKLPGEKGFWSNFGISQCIVQRGMGKDVISTVYYDNFSVEFGDPLSEIEPPVWNEESRGLELRFSPEDKSTCQQNPPFFKWPAFILSESYEFQLSRDKNMENIDYHFVDIKKNFLALNHTLDVGVWYWRVKGKNLNGESEWSQIRRFRINRDAWEFPVPSADELITMVREDHPRIWVNSDTLAEYRQLADGPSKDFFQEIKDRVDKNLNNEIPSEPILTYPENATADEINVAKNNLRADSDVKVNEMFEAAYVYIITGDENYAQKAIDFLMAISSWDINGFTSYWVQDQVHRAIAYKSAITYDWVYSLLTQPQRDQVLAMVIERTKIMFDSLLRAYPLAEDPYNSHGWSAAEFMLIISLAIMKDAPEAEEWFKEIAPLIITVLSVWGGEDGGFSQGTAYGSFANSMFLAVTEDAFYSATGFKIWDRAYERNEHKFFMYFSPNGAPFGAFGDEAYTITSRDSTVVNSHMASAVRYNNEAAKWASETRGISPYTGEISYYHYFSDNVKSTPPFNYLSSRIDKDIGWVSMMSDLIDPRRIEVLFKSSFYGSYNHSHADQNSFIIAAYGEPLATDNGYYDYYFSEHDKRYAKTTIAHNAITYNDSKGQYFEPSDSAGNINSKGEVKQYLHGDIFNTTTGDATEAYSQGLDKTVRHMIYLKPSMVIVVDELKAKNQEPTEFEFNLQALSPYEVYEDESKAVLNRGRAKMIANVAYPKITKIDQFDRFLDINGEEIRPGTRHADKRNQFAVRFNTERVPETVMVTTLDILKQEEPGKKVTVNQNEECMEIIVEDSYYVYIRLKQDGEVTYNDVTFDGSAAVIKDGSYLLVNGTKLTKGGINLITAEEIGSYSFEGGEVHVSSSYDTNIKMNIPYEVYKIEDEKGFEIKSINAQDYDYNTMPFKWSFENQYLSVDIEKGYWNLYFNGTSPIKYNELTVRVNGTPVEFNNNPYLDNGVLYAPLSELAKAYGATVNEENGTYSIVKGNSTVTVNNGSSIASVNGVQKDMGYPGRFYNGIFYVPFRGYFGTFTDRIGWSDYANTAYVYTEPVYKDDMSSSVWPRTDIMTKEEQEEMEKKK